MIRRLLSRLISAIAPTWPGDYSRLDRADGLGAWWCTYGTRHDIDEDCTCSSANVLAVAFPDHGRMVPDQLVDDATRIFILTDDDPWGVDLGGADVVDFLTLRSVA